MLKNKAILLVFLVLQGLGLVQAQEEIASDRPAYTWSSSTLKNKQIQLQSGYNLFNNRSNFGRKKPYNSNWNIESLVRFGLTKKFELDAGYSYVALVPSLLINNTLTACLRYQVSDNDGFIPQSTVLYKYDFSIRNQNLANTQSHALIYSASWKLSEKLGFATANTLDLRNTQWIGSTINFSYAANSKWGLVAEAFIQSKTSTFYNLAITYKHKPNLMFDVYAGPQTVRNEFNAIAIQGGISWLMEVKQKTSE